MAKFFTRLFGIGSSSKDKSFRNSQTSLDQNQSRHNRTISSVRTSASLENLASYHVIPKELEKNKLHKASWEGNLNKVERLARPGQINVKDPQKRTPLHLAVVKGHIEIVQYLVQEGAKLDVIDNEQRTPLIKAVLSGNQNPKVNYQICQILINGGAGVYINAVDNNGRNALHYAIDFGNEYLVNLFLANENCDPNFKDRDQMTPLHLAIKRNSPKIVQLLLSDQHDQQADPNIPNRYGQTPLHIAATVGYVDIVRFLLVSDLNESCDPTLVDSQQSTAYELAKANHQETCAKLIDEYQEKWLRKSTRRPTSTSINEHSSVKATSSISIIPAANLQREHDETSDESTSVTTSKPSILSSKRQKRPSDQWSDENESSMNLSKPQSRGLGHLMKSIPLQPDGAVTNGSKTGNSTMTNLINTNVLLSDTKKTASTRKPTTSRQTQPSSFFGIGPIAERNDSDNTSTSMSLNRSVIPARPTTQNKPVTSNPYVNTVLKPALNTKSWSDDTIKAAAPKHPQLEKKASTTNTWDSSSATQSDDEDTGVYKSKHAASPLQKTLPFQPSINNRRHSESDDDPIEAELRKLDIKKPSNGTAAHALVNTGYKVVGPKEIQSPMSEDSSWTISSLAVNKKGINTIVQQQPLIAKKTDESTWDDSRPLSTDLKQYSNVVSNLIQTNIRPVHSPEIHTTGIENLAKIIDAIMHLNNKRSKSPKIIGKLLVSSMSPRNDSVLSDSNSTPQHASHEIDNDEDDERTWRKKTEEWPATATIGHNFKTLRQLPRSTLPHEMNLRGSISSTASSFHDARFNELKENIKKIEQSQDDSRELKRQLKDMENKKNNFEELYKKKDELLRDTESKLEHEKTEKQRLEWTTKNLNTELKSIKQKLQSLEDEKDTLNQRFTKLKEERNNHDDKLRILQTSGFQSTTPGTVREEDIERIKSRHREEMKLLSAENDDLHNRSKQLQSDLDLHRDSLDVTVRYKIDLEKALEEKTFFQQEFDRLKHEKDLIEQEKMEYKIKYDSLQEEIRIILLDRAKLEQRLTGELHEHIQERQRSTADIRNCKTEMEQVNMKLGDAEARLLVLQTQKEALLTTKDQEIKSEFETLSQRLNMIESEKSNAEQRYHNQHKDITHKHHVSNEPLVILTSKSLSNGTHHQHSTSSSCIKCNTLQRSYDQERENRLQTEKDNERLRDTVSRQKQYHSLNRSFQQQDNEHYLVESSRQIRSDTTRVKHELDRLRQDFDKLVSNYEPASNLHQHAQLHTQIDTFRQFYEQEFRERQASVSKLTSGMNRSLSIDHKHSLNENMPCAPYTNSRLFKERLETAIDTTLADQRLQAIKQIPVIPRRASSLLTINKTNDDIMSHAQLLRKRYYV